jgi:maltose alpha-D-glucosyltransferase/alpha-amylase
VEGVVSEWHDVTIDPATFSDVPLLDLAERPTPEIAQQTIGSYLHADDPRFRSEPFSTLYQRSLYQSMRTQARQTFQLLRKQLSRLPESARAEAERVLSREAGVQARLKAIMEQKISCMRIRVHGDYHLGQVLFTGKDFVIIDFEGEPDRSIGERRIKRSPLRDVAGMIRSFHYASNAALVGSLPGTMIADEQAERIGTWMRFWYAWTSAAFLGSYLEHFRTPGILPASRAELQTLLNAYMLEKLMYELRYELNSRPTWVRIPLEGILQLSESTA